ncbi:restriction endonuclease subunit S [Micromonospora sp. NPDC049301]|uniref:restriction endonuclease subunit S n=1 Tax=Micromonospora sp. NPDC049301 TaxID=3155723 RepID=UPI003415736D
MASEYVSQGVLFLRSQNVRPGRLDLANCRWIPAEFHERLRKSQLNPGDIVIVRTGIPGAAALIPDGLGPVNCSDLIIVRPGAEIDARFLCYSINATAASFVVAHTVGAVQQHFNIGSARNLVITLPAKQEQHAIADALSALDDKIAVNERIADTSCALALSLFSEERWSSRTSLSSLCRLSKVQLMPSTLNVPSVAHHSLPAFDSGQVPDVCSPEKILSTKFLVDEPSVLLSKLNPDIPRVWRVEPKVGVPAFASTEFLVLAPNPTITTAELWAVARQGEFLSRLAARVTGTSKSHQRVRPDEVLGSNVVDIRAIDIVTRQQVASLVERAEQAREEGNTLAQLRGALLPKLISGELRIKDAERLVSDAV